MSERAADITHHDPGPPVREGYVQGFHRPVTNKIERRSVTPFFYLTTLQLGPTSPLTPCNTTASRTPGPAKSPYGFPTRN